MEDSVVPSFHNDLKSCVECVKKNSTKNKRKDSSPSQHFWNHS